jgi:hypothetical protein
VVKVVGDDTKQDGEAERDRPEQHSMPIGKEQLERLQVVLKVVIAETDRHLEASDEEEHTHTTNAADEDVPGEITYQGPELEGTKGEEDQTCQDGAERKGDHGRRHDGDIIAL